MANYWISTYNNTSTVSSSNMCLDALDNIYTVSTVSNNTNQIEVNKYTSTGILEWSSVVYYSADTTKSISSAHIAVDSLGNSYVTGNSYIDSTHKYVIFVKLDTNGNIVWDKSYVNGNHSAIYLNTSKIAIDSSDNLIVGMYGDWNTGYSTNIGIAKFNSDGVLQWGTRLWRGNDYLYDIKIVNDKISICGKTNATNYYTCAYTAEISLANGGPLWQATWKEDGGDISNNGVARDSLDNTYSAGKTWSASYLTLTKFNSSGSKLWSYYYNTINSSYATMDFDSSDNLYVASGGHIMKFNSSGIMQWRNTASAIAIKQLLINSKGDIVFTGNITVNSVGNLIVGVLPADGTGTGTYGTITYSSGTVISNSTLSLLSWNAINYVTAGYNQTTGLLNQYKIYRKEEVV